jgi:hypothetical protein
MAKIKNTDTDVKAIHEDEHRTFRTRQQADKTWYVAGYERNNCTGEKEEDETAKPGRHKDINYPEAGEIR